MHLIQSAEERISELQVGQWKFLKLKSKEKEDRKHSRISKNCGTAIKGCDIYTVEIADRKKKKKERNRKNI